MGTNLTITPVPTFEHDGGNQSDRLFVPDLFDSSI